MRKPMGPLPPYVGEAGIEEQESEEDTLSVGRKMVLLVVALVIFHLIAIVSVCPNACI